MTNADIKSLSTTELKEKIGSEKESLRKVQFAHQVSAIENPMKIKETKRLIARLMTELTVKESQQ
jgi:large subunit ribosomal protein L29